MHGVGFSGLPWTARPRSAQPTLISPSDIGKSPHSLDNIVYVHLTCCHSVRISKINCLCKRGSSRTCTGFLPQALIGVGNYKP